MRIPSLVFGIAVTIAAVLRSAAADVEATFITHQRSEAAGPQACLTTRSHGEASDVARPRSAPDLPGLWVVSAAHEPLDTVEILGIAEQTPEADGRRKVTVRVKYTLSSYPKGVLGLGFNLRLPNRFSLVRDKWVQAGCAETELSAMIVPVTWPNARPFKIVVNLSAEVHPTRWTSLAMVAEPMACSPGGAIPTLAEQGTRNEGIQNLVRREPAHR